MAASDSNTHTQGAAHSLRIACLPSFALRWLVPRLGRWREEHPTIKLEIHATPGAVDLRKDRYDAVLGQAGAVAADLASEMLFQPPMPFIVVGSPEVARRLSGKAAQALAREPLLGYAFLWERWFEAAGVKTDAHPFAVFNDATLMFEAAELGIGLAIGREVLAADALADGRLVRVSDVSIVRDDGSGYNVVYDASAGNSPPLSIFLQWLRNESRAQMAR